MSSADTNAGSSAEREPGEMPAPELSKPRGDMPQANYHDLLDNLNEAVFTTDDRGRFTYLNTAWAELIGRPAPELLGRFCGHLVHPEDRRTFRKEFLSMLGGRLPVHRCEVRLLRADGGSRWVRLSVRQFQRHPHEVPGLAGTAMDVSEARQAHEELNQARQAAEAANRAKTEFLSTMSHELRTPLNAVIGLAESLLESGAPFDATRTQRYLGMIKDGGHQLLSQINLILDLVRLESGRIRVNATEFDLGALSSTALDSLQRETQAKSLKTELQRPALPLLIRADERLIWQVLTNLLGNSVKFTPARGSIAMSISPRDATSVSIVVRDTGIGIPPDKMHLLFQPFSQVDSSLSRRYGGAGLGLALVYRLVRLHGGNVSVESAPGAGTAFTVVLPRGQPPGEGALPGRAQQEPQGGSDPRSLFSAGEALPMHA